jgi:hypothetical protein
MTDDEQYDTDEPAGALTTQRGNNQIARQDFQGGSLATVNGAIEAMVAKSRAEVEAACIMAKRWPRNPDQVRQDLIAECKRPGFAAVAIYSLPRGEKKIEGLSIRFAEVAMRCSGNMSASSETIYDDPAVRCIRVKVVDYERNSMWQTDITINKTVERRQLKRGQKPLGERINSYGDRVFIVEATDDDVRTKQNAEISKASRTGILRIIPGHLQDEARRLCKATVSKADAADPAAARDKLFDAFGSIGVKPAALEQWLGHSTDTISPAELDDLRGLFAAIRDGETTWADALKEVAAEGEVKPAAKPATNGGAPPAPAAAPQGPPPGVPPVPAEPAKPREPTPPADLPRTGPRTSSGKGTAALKGALTSKPAPAAPPPVQQAMPMADLPPGTPPPSEGNEYRTCAGCSDTIEVPKTDMAGALCDACSSAGRGE